MTTTTSSPIGRLLTRLLPIEPHEIRAVVAAFFLFFFMWAGYFAVRPVRETVGTLLGREQVADLWIVTAIASIALIPVYGAVVAYLRRSIFLPGIYACVAALLVFVGLALQGAEFNPLDRQDVLRLHQRRQSAADLGFLELSARVVRKRPNEASLRRHRGRRQRRRVGRSADLGPLGRFHRRKRHSIPRRSAVRARPSCASACCSRSGRIGRTRWPARIGPSAATVFAGVTLVLRSPYLLGIALFIVGVSAASTLLYFEQLRIVEITFAETAERTRVFARHRLDRAEPHGAHADLSNRPHCGTLRRHRIAHDRTDRHGLRLPRACGVRHVRPVRHRLGHASLGEYAFARPGREMLWSPLDKETKYKAKNTIDVPVYRGADAVIAQAQSAISAAGMTATGIMMSARWPPRRGAWSAGGSADASRATRRRTSAELDIVAQESKA